MRRLPITLLSTAIALSVTAQKPSTHQRQDTAQKDTTVQTNGNTTTDMSRPYATQDTLRLKLNRPNVESKGPHVDSKAVEIKKPDTFKEKMKEPWLGGLLKDIIFR